MANGVFSTESIDYLQRCLPLPATITGGSTSGASNTRRLVRVSGIGRPDKEFQPRPVPAEERWRARTTGLVTGLYGYRIPVAFYLEDIGEGIRLHLGTWSARPDARPDAQDRRRDVIAAVLRGLYPTVTIGPAENRAPDFPLTGLALGTPSPVGNDDADGAAPIDRIIRSMAGTSWAVLLLAYPVAEAAVVDVRAQILNEMRTVENAAKTEGAPSPLAEQYVELLKVSLAGLGEGLATGSWRTAVYLLGDGDSYPRLGAAWRSVFSGDKSLPEPVRVFDRPEVSALAGDWALPDTEGEQGPGYFRRPFEFQTMLTTAQLATYVHLPELETAGFAVDAAPRFDVAAGADREGVVVGRILHHKQPTATDYQVPLRSLTKHAFVAGTTGAGKTNTIFALLTEADTAGVPFLVIEPAKAEYRALIEHPSIGPRLRVFTAGKPAVAPLLLNPFEVAPGTTVSEHLDLVRAAFAAAFGMWTPLPQILERCLHEVYVDRGWDMRTNSNRRLAEQDEPAEAFPTLTDLVAKARAIIPTLGYDEKVTGDMQAALTTRLESLRTGGKGAMFDVGRSLPIADLLAEPTVIELEPMGDEGDKAFLTALLLIRLAEHRRAQGQADALVHLLVVEEAHRLLANVATEVSEETANPRGQAVETFANLLSEVRAYGQGVIIADQIPVRLAPDVVKNTTLKIAHRVVSADDRAALGAAMAMDEAQTKALTTLEVGEAAVFSTGDDSPLLVAVPPAKNQLSPIPPPDDAVAEHMAAWRADSGHEALYWPRPFCPNTCADAPQACAVARALAGDEYVQRNLSRTILSLIEEPDAFDRLWDDLVGVIRARRPPDVDEAALLRAFAGHGADWLAQHRGAQAGWSYADTTTFDDHVRTALLCQVYGDGSSLDDAVTRLQEIARRLYRRTYDPFPACSHVCTQDPPVCLYRSAVADLVADGRYQASWRSADATDAGADDGNRQQTWEVCQDAAYEIIEFPEEDAPPELKERIVATAKRVCLCFEQQMLIDDRRKTPRTARRILARVMAEAEL